MATKTYPTNILKLRQERNLIIVPLADNQIHCYDFVELEDDDACVLDCREWMRGSELFCINSIDYASSMQAELVLGDAKGELHVL